ncbi:hypothetical protein G2W53_014606 [Senna tora]|uniref:Uncharacterized protein n=1 Tax=Senna tora TaxID=362788 RepID=A0A834WU20_9FABA|nr:hypothetical protein G2W53_014606 [Senna tora]
MNHEGRTENPNSIGWTDFHKSSHSSFKAEFDPKKVAECLEELEELFEVYGNTNDQKVLFGTHMLKAFLEKYFPRNIRNQNEVEFLRIKQGDTPSEKILVEYEVLADHSSYLRANPDEKWKCMPFVSALKPKLKNIVVPMEIKNFAILVNKCRLCNESMVELEKDTQQSNSFKRKQTGYAKGNGYKGNKNDWGNKPKTGQVARANCPECGKNYGDKPCLAG